MRSDLLVGQRASGRARTTRTSAKIFKSWQFSNSRLRGARRRRLITGSNLASPQPDVEPGNFHMDPVLIQGTHPRPEERRGEGRRRQYIGRYSDGSQSIYLPVNLLARVAR